MPVKTKSLKIGARVTPEQKSAIKELMAATGFDKESEYILYCCLKSKDMRFQSPYQFERMEKSDSNRMVFRVTKDEKEKILEKYKLSHINNFSRFIRNCCLDKPIIVFSELSDFAKQLNKIGNNLNQLTMLCHQGLIADPDIKETTDCLKNIYKELSVLQKKFKLGR